MNTSAGSTSQRRSVGLIGSPVSHSLSPAMHTAAFVEAGLRWEFHVWDIPAGGAAVAITEAHRRRLVGLSVTMPLKLEAAAAAASLDDAARFVGAANCVLWREDGSLHAANTDAVGFLDALRADAGVSPAGKRVVVLGAGGAARAVAWAAASVGAADVAVLNRSLPAAEATAQIAAPVGRVAYAADIASADIVINATPVGMPGVSGVPCDPETVQAGGVAVDLVYEPAETVWLAALRRRGVQTHNGLSMLVHQAAASFEMWTGTAASATTMRRAAEAAIAGRHQR